jgi:hypothetical protein
MWVVMVKQEDFDQACCTYLSMSSSGMGCCLTACLKKSEPQANPSMRYPDRRTQSCIAVSHAPVRRPITTLTPLQPIGLAMLPLIHRSIQIHVLSDHFDMCIASTHAVPASGNL